MVLETNQDLAPAPVLVLGPKVVEALVLKALQQVDWQQLQGKHYSITETDLSREAAAPTIARTTAAALPCTRNEAKALASMCRKEWRRWG